MAAGRPAFRYQAIISVLAILLVNAVISSLAGFWHLHVTASDLLLYSAATVVFAWASWRFPWPTAALVLVAGAGLVAAIMTGYSPQVELYLRTVAGQVNDFAQSWREAQLEASFGPALGMLFLIGAALGTALLVLPESLAKGNTFWAIALGTLVFGTEWAWYYEGASSHFVAFSVLAFAIWILGQAAHRDAHWVASGRKVGYPSHVVTPLAWVLVLAMLALILPSTFEPMDLGSLGEKAQEAFPVLKQLRGAGVGSGSGRFTLRTTGFSPNLDALGGPVTLDRSPALHVTADQPLTETAYLRGATYEGYDGRTWSRGKPADVPVPKDGTLPTYFSSDVPRDYLTAKVTHSQSMGLTVFNLWEPMQVVGLKSDYKADADGNLWATKNIAKGTTYTIYARMPRYSAEQLRTIRSTDAGDAYTPYLEVPKTLPDRVATLTGEITARQPTPFDKAVAIEAYLRSLPYDLNVKSAPQGQDFVDYFLFDLRRGYCLYSATAMTVMLREVGIPSRMVEGFAIPAAAQYTEDSTGKRTYTVLNSQAHAWVEAYFPGYGWVTFDPTPRGDLPVIDRSAPAPQPDQTDTTGDPNNPRSKPSVPDPQQQENLNEGAGRAGGSGGLTADRVTREWPWALTAVAFVGGLFLLAYRRLRSQERIASREERQVVQEVWSKAGSLMKQFNFGPKPDQTAMEYATDLGTRWPALKEPADVVAREYTEARYSPPDHPVSDEAPQHARTFWNRVQELLLNRFGWRIYFWRRLRWRDKSGD